MELSVRQRECLAKMGITLYERKIDPSKVHWICIDETLTEPKRQLLSRMLIALRWPAEQCVTFQKEAIRKQQGDPISGIILSDKPDPTFDDLLDRYQQIIQIPSLQTLLVDVGAKKQAWQKMQILLYNAK